MNPSTDPVLAADGLRLQLKTTLGEGLLDGAWWPRSRNLTTELQALADHWPAHQGHIARALYSQADWDSPPRRIYSAGSIIPAGSFPGDDTHLIVLTMAGSRRRVQLLVIPADTSTADAQRAVDLALRLDAPRTAVQILSGLTLI